MNYEEIAAMLAAGKSEEDIVKEFTDNLNKANAEVAAKRETEEKMAAAERNKNNALKDSICADIADALNEYAVVSGMENPGIEPDDVRETLDSVLELVPMLKNLSIQIATPKKTHKVGVAGKGKSNFDDVFADFFKSLGI
jgi:hypothetical protein